ncbi:MAG TPA: hypothetical protein VD993_01025 [Chitinophagaceae bacterium]|nr:hypothetical protein [Chitinophagaceae bacterium]
MKRPRPAYQTTFRIAVTVICCVVILIAALPGFAQQPLAVIQEQFNAYKQQAPQEKLFVHTDKSFYLTGETIWFKIYHVDAATHMPTDLSKVAYVELLDHEGKPLVQAKVGLGERNGNRSGSLLLPAYLGSGNYMLRAYTNWMKNFDKSYFFQKTITLVNTSRRPDWQSLEKREAYTIRFFPEGGNLVYGLQSRIAFHITDQYGKGIEGEGIVSDEKNDTTSRSQITFKTSGFGMGSFDFVPHPNSNYKAWVRLANGKTISAPLPQVFRQGAVMRVTETGNDRLTISVTTTDTDRALPVYLLVHTRQAVKLALAKNFNNGKAEWIIEKNALGEGVSHLTIFNDARQPVCERLYFKRPTANMNISIRTDQQEYNTRSKVTLDINTQNERNAPIRGDLSVSVFMIDSLQPANMQTIEQYLWLGSDLAGPIESPAYYFSQPSEEVNRATDHLMLTQGWRRFRWEDMAQNSKPAFEFLPEYEGITVHARVIDKTTGNPAPGVTSYLSFADQQFQVGNAVSNENGRTIFVTRDIFGPNEMVLQADSNSNRYRIDVIDAFAPPLDSIRLPRFALPEAWRGQLETRHLNAMLSNSFQPVQVGQFIVPAAYDTSLFYGTPDRQYYLDDYTRFPTMEEVMREFVDAVRIRKDASGYYFQVLNIPAQLHFNAGPVVLLDGVPLFKLDKLIAFDPLKIRKIEVMGRKYYWGNLTCNGIVSFSTYEGDLAGFELDPAAVVVEFQGLQLQREFYHPDYSTPDKKNSRMPDTRNVLFWQAHYISGAGGNMQSSFYTSDLPGNYLIVVQGISANGLPGTSIKTIVVK